VAKVVNSDVVGDVVVDRMKKALREEDGAVVMISSVRSGASVALLQNTLSFYHSR